MTKKLPHITVSIWLKGHALDPAQVSEILGIKPTDSRKQGEARTGKRSGKTYINKIGIWHLTAENKSQGGVDEFHQVPKLAGELIQMLARRNEPLDQIPGVETAELNIFIQKDMDPELDGSNMVEFSLSKAQVLRIGQLGLAIRYDTWINGDYDIDDLAIEAAAPTRT